MSDDQPGEVGPQDEPTQAIPPAPDPQWSAPAAPGWAAPGGSSGDEPTVAMPAPVPGPPQAPPLAPPTAPQAPPAAPGHPQQPYSQPQPYPQQQPYSQPQPYGQQQPYGQPSAPPQPPDAPSPKRNRTMLVLALVVLAVIAVGGAIAAAIVMGSGDASMEVAIDTCEISASGTVTATGTLRHDGADRASVGLEVTFSDVATGEEFATERIDLRVAGDSSERWNAAAQAGDEVQQVTCDVTVRP